MEQLLRQRAESIWTAAIRSVLPDEAVRRALEHFHPQGRVFLVAAGKAAWQMAHAALAVLGRVDAGIVITKYGHVRGPLPGVTCCEAGHPVPDDNSFAATQRALALVSGLRADDTVLFLLSGGGSALFEKPLLPAEELQAITQALLACGADIVEINTIRKRLSAVKGGRFALACAPAAVYSVVLSDILGDPLDMIASGPACPDSSTCAQAAAIAEKYGKLDILANNAGIIYKNPVDKLEMDRFKKVIDINLNGVTICTKHAVPYMKKAGWGRIVNVSSSQAFLTSETYSAYSASKAAVSHLTRIWGNELADYNILVNAICPCYVMTPMMVGSIARKAAELGTGTDGGYKYFADLVPTHRLLEVEEVGNWAAVLCSELGLATTGSNISITCGQVQL